MQRPDLPVITKPDYVSPSLTEGVAVAPPLFPFFFLTVKPRSQVFQRGPPSDFLNVSAHSIHTSSLAVKSSFDMYLTS